MPHVRGPFALVADGEDAGRRLVRSHLEALGFRILEAADGDELLLRCHQIDARRVPLALIIIDAGLTRCNAYEALHVDFAK